MILPVWEYLGISQEEFYKTRKSGICIKCGLEAINKYHCLCRGHHSAFHRWINKKEREALE